MSDPSFAGYQAARSGVAWIDRSDRVRLLVTGPDRVKFLHNLTTNDVKGLAVGVGCEAFVTSPQGKTLGFVTLHARADAILLRADEGALEHLRPHLEEYAIFDDIALDDLGARTFEVHFAGALEEDPILEFDVDLPDFADLANCKTSIAGRSIELIRESPTGSPGLTLIGARDDAAAILDTLRAAGGPLGLTDLSRDEFDALRIEAGTPVFGRDITTASLPQEAGRNARAISFTKGCYLGQETVARLDAMGHVNKILRGLVIDDGPRTEPAGDLAAVEPTSLAYSPRWGKRVGLAMVKVKSATHRTRVEVAIGGERFGAVVQELPMTPGGGVNRIADFADQ
ncbi:MAG TPA: glycine cleavage T C-terminal barrel domain-containing protein [Isosphaeraceae bacterium]|nr:glycine cleavage T C-terminal barrel domain-containing protein [Isosphaeraceae bacterium]